MVGPRAGRDHLPVDDRVPVHELGSRRGHIGGQRRVGGGTPALQSAGRGEYLRGVAELGDRQVPIHEVPHLTTPKFFMAGDVDRNTTLKESRALYEAAAGPKQLWIVNGARHEDLHHFAPKEYETRMLAFLARYLPR